MMMRRLALMSLLLASACSGGGGGTRNTGGTGGEEESGGSTGTGGKAAGGTGGGTGGSKGEAGSGGGAAGVSGSGGSAGVGGTTDAGPRDTAPAADAPISDAPAVTSGFAVVTNRYDNARTGANTQETVLTTSNVKIGSFGLLFSRQYDGNPYAQPLFVSGLNIGGKVRDVVFVATSTNHVYAFDATDPAAGMPLWSRQLALAGEVRVGGTRDGNTITGQTWCQDMFPFVGITGTPVIDPDSRRMYVVTKTGKIGGQYAQKLHALDLITGADVAGSPVNVEASVPGTGAGASGGRVSLDPWKHMNRTGLLLAHGSLFVGFTSHCDDDPYHGWVLAYDPATLRQKSVYNTAPDGTRGGIWQSGVGLSANDKGVFFVVGNGTASPDGKSVGMSVVRLNADNTLGDWFTPSNLAALNSADQDLTSGALLIDNWVLGGGKEGVIYVVDQMNMTHFTPAGDRIPQRLSIRDPGVTRGGHLHSMVFWNNRVYVWPEAHGFKGYSFTNGRLSTTPVVQFNGIKTDHPGAIMSLSANGTKAGTGLVWATLPITGDAWHDIAGGILVAVDATTGFALWNSDMNAADKVGNFAKFSVPIVANGRVYVTSFAKVNASSPAYLRVYGLK
jgi:hypothetical protein